MKRLTIFIGLAFLITACATTGWKSTELIEKQDLEVSLERRIEDDRPVSMGYAHPARVPAAVIDDILAELAYMAPPRIWGDPEQQPVFQQQERRRLAPALRLALAKATPDQRIRFISFNRGGGLLFSDRRKTEAVVYVDDRQHLNMAFSDINTALQSDQRPEATSPARQDPFEIQSTDTPLVAEAGYIVHHRPGDADENRPMWVEVDLAKAKAAGRQEKRPNDSESPAQPAKPGETPPDAQSPAPAKKGKAASESPEATPDQWQKDKQKIRTRLEYLKELYDDGLIDQAEYEAQKKQILKKID